MHVKFYTDMLRVSTMQQCLLETCEMTDAHQTWYYFDMPASVVSS